MLLQVRGDAAVTDLPSCRGVESQQQQHRKAGGLTTGKAFTIARAALARHSLFIFDEVQRQ